MKCVVGLWTESEALTEVLLHSDLVAVHGVWTGHATEQIDFPYRKPVLTGASYSFPPLAPGDFCNSETYSRSMVPIHLPGKTNRSYLFSQPGPLPDLLNRGMLPNRQADKAGQTFWLFQLNIHICVCWTLTNLGFVPASKRLKRQFSGDQLSCVLEGGGVKHLRGGEIALQGANIILLHQRVDFKCGLHCSI